MLIDDLGEKKIVAKRPEFWHVGSVSPEKHCFEVFSLGCSFFSRINVCKTLGFSWPGLCLHVFVEQETGKLFSVQSQNQISELIEAEIWE